MASEILVFQLSTGAKIPSVGIGTWQAESGFVGAAVDFAVKNGYRHIDFAKVYNNEKETGTVLKKLFDDGELKREDIFITSKLWSKDHAPEDVPMALEGTLRDLQLDYIDLSTGQFVKKGSTGLNPEKFVNPDIPGTWRALEALYDAGKAGKARAIGVSNSSKKLGDLLEQARVPPAVNQVECHPSSEQAKLRAFCKSRGVHLSGYSPLGSPGTTWFKSDVLY